MNQKIKMIIYNIIRDDDENDLISTIFDGLIIGLIIINIVIVILDTFLMPIWYTDIANKIEIISIAIFSIEYILRFYTSDLKFENRSKLKSIIKYVFSFMALIDLLAILPFFIPLIFPVDLRVLRSLRIVRLFRIFKINRYTDSLSNIAQVFKNKKYDLLSSFFIVSLLMLISSVLMYSLENESQPEVFSNAFSGLWWAVATFTTVGYGDIFPITVGGKIMAGIIAVLGIGLVAVPTGIISSGFIELLNTKKEELKINKFCQHCGERLN